MLREDQQSGEGENPESRDRSDDETTVREPITCAVCDRELSTSEHIIAMSAKGASQAFANPYGQLREILTLSKAWNLDCDESSTTDFTWYAGYAWRIAYCGHCHQHLGWRFEAVQEASPSFFYGLLIKAINRPRR